MGPTSIDTAWSAASDAQLNIEIALNGVRALDLLTYDTIAFDTANGGEDVKHCLVLGIETVLKDAHASANKALDLLRDGGDSARQTA